MFSTNYSKIIYIMSLPKLMHHFSLSLSVFKNYHDTDVYVVAEL